jgi:hypothetical protein
MSRMNVLVLHQMGDPRYRREAVRALEYMIPESRNDVNCIVHDAGIPFPKYLRDIDYHLIVLGPTFLCNRYDPKALARTLAHYDFIRESSACKVALPQDDYDCSKILDDWMVHWKIDRVYSVCPDKWEILYPGYLIKGEISLGYTCYISDSWLDRWSKPKPHNHRSIDISYRASKLPANFGQLGNLKGDIARRFQESLPRNDLRLDISVDPKDMIPGSRWHYFLEDSKFCLSTPSGSSLLDPNGEFRAKVMHYTLSHPQAQFQEIAQHCFGDADGKYIFSAISPRNIEAALAETVQIATYGPYSGLMSPMEDYILLAEDCSNIHDVLRLMADTSYVKKIKSRCKESVLSAPRLRRTVIVNEIIEFAQSIVTERKLSPGDQAKTEQLLKRYASEIKGLAWRHWLRYRFRGGLRSVAIKLGARHVQRWLLTLGF